MWHAMLSPYLNLGLLHPLEVIQSAERAYHQHQLDLRSIEGFIRQLLGWREYMYGIYHFMDTDYSQRNWFNHTQPLPEFFWDATQTDMNCLHQVLTQVQSTGYAHHIQRLMILSNFALIAGISPQALGCPLIRLQKATNSVNYEESVTDSIFYCFLSSFCLLLSYVL